MANATATNPIAYDTVGATSAITKPVNVTAIVVEPTAATWAAVIHNASGGDIVFSAQDNLQAPFSVSFPIPLRVKGLYATTLTDCKVYIYRQ